MKFGVYSILDRKTGYLQPVFEQNDASAVRNFAHAVMQGPGSLFFSHAEDYVLCHIGYFESNTGELQPVEKTFLAEASDFKHEKE